MTVTLHPVLAIDGDSDLVNAALALTPAQAKRLSHEERQAATRTLLSAAAETDGRAERARLLDQVVVLNMRVAEALARRYSAAGNGDDLTQVAYAALVRAVGNFDPSRDIDLLGYAVPSIRGELRRYLRDHGWAVRPPRDVQRAHSRLAAVGVLAERWSDADLASLAECLDETPETVAAALHLRDSGGVVSLDRSVGSDDVESLSDLLADPGADHTAELMEARLTLSPLLADLPPRERTIVRLRFVDELSQRDIAERVGVSQMQVSRILRRVLSDLRARLALQEARAS